MNKSDDLFELIHSMSKAEKRHFKLSVGTFGGGQNYLRLYETIEEQPLYNEAEIEKKFKGEVFLKQLHVTKNYLYNLILKNLKNFHEGNSIRQLLREQLNSYELLFQRKLYRQAEKLLKRTKKMAEEHETFQYLMEVLDKEEQALRITNDVKKLEVELKKIYEDREQIIDKIQNGYIYKKISSEMLVLSHKAGVSRKKEIAEEYEKIFSLPAMKSPSLAYTDMATGFYHQILSSYYYYTLNYKKTYYHLLQQKIFIESTPVRKKKFKAEYVNVVSNMLILGEKFLPFNKMEEMIASFKNILKEIPDEAERILQPYYVISIGFYSRYGEFGTAITIAKEAAGWIKNFKIIRRADNYDTVLNQKIAYAYFGAEKYKEALSWLNKAINVQERDNIKMDIYPYLLTFNLILHFELGNNELLPYLTRSTFRFLSKKEKLFRFEKIILLFIRNTSLEFKNKHEQRGEFIKLRDQLAPLKNNPMEKQPFEHFDFIAWLDSKIENISFAQAVKRQS